MTIAKDKIRRASWFLLKLFAIYLLLLAFLYFFQRNYIYFPSAYVPLVEESDIANLKAIDLETSDGIALSPWYLEPESSDKPVIVFFHGNGSNLLWQAIRARPYAAAGNGVMIVAYRGYNGAQGSPSEAGLYRDAAAHLSWLGDQGIGPERIVLYGNSLGTAIATEMAVQNPDIAAVILEAPFTSMVAMARIYYPFVPVKLLLRDRFDTLGKIKTLSMPVMIVHGDADEVVPHSHGKTLYEAAGRQHKRFETVEGGRHNNLHRYPVAWKVLEFLQDVGVFPVQGLRPENQMKEEEAAS